MFFSSQVSFNLPAAVNFDPYTPRISLDSKKVIASEAFAVTLKEHLTELFKQPVESRLQLIKPGEYALRNYTEISCVQFGCSN